MVAGALRTVVLSVAGGIPARHHKVHSWSGSIMVRADVGPGFSAALDGVLVPKPPVQSASSEHYSIRPVSKHVKSLQIPSIQVARLDFLGCPVRPVQPR